MTDEPLIGRIERLIEEERTLRGSGQGLSGDQEQQIQRLETELDQCWDLLRQRRAAREYEGDPSDATVRDADTVESYEQ